ncbi:Tyrosine recombinase XerD [termite gut metagenome]|uniref:Tyrosine recombinase XerD n=1 Tax=termite gut metagenome TaxID=433724 RepID=A0A5J4R6X8_9ZZZZ
MSNYLFNGIYAEHIKQLIALKRNLGYKYITEESILYNFDLFTIMHNVTTPTITQEVADAWMAKRKHEAASTQKGKITPFMQLAFYMCDIGLSNYIPRVPRIKIDYFVPYIYTPDEIQSIFTSCDKLLLKSLKKDSIIIFLPALFRLLYGSGLRVTEAITLLDKDVNLDDNYLIVRDTKNKTDRMMPISKSLSNVLKKYRIYREKLPVKIDKEYFFLSLAGKKCANHNLIYTWFRVILNKAGIAHEGNHHGPRIHDIRHTFSVHALMQMDKNGSDLYCSLSVLSNYLGHSSIASTNSYVRLCNEMYPELIKTVELENLNIFPLLKNDETD